MSIDVRQLTAPVINYEGYRVFPDGHLDFDSGTWTNIDLTSGNNTTRNDETLILKLADEHRVLHGAFVYFTNDYENVSYTVPAFAYRDVILSGRASFMGVRHSPDQNQANVFYTFSGKSPCMSESYVAFNDGNVGYAFASNSGQLDFLINYFDGVPIPLTTNASGEYNLITTALYYRGQWSPENRAHIKIVP